MNAQSESASGQAQPSAPRRMRSSLELSRGADTRRRVGTLLGQGLLLAVTSASAVAVLFIFLFIIREALPFFRLRGFVEFFTHKAWYPSADPPEFGSLAIFVGSGLVTAGAVLFAVPLGVFAAVCLSDILPFAIRQAVKPVIEVLASIPSVAYGFFALVVLAPLLQDHGGRLLAAGVWIAGLPVAMLVCVLLAEAIVHALHLTASRVPRLAILLILGVLSCIALGVLARRADAVAVSSGANALNVSLILAVMVLPTVVSVSEDALQAVGRELREASYACGATRAETIVRVVLPAASSGICSAVILGLMRAVGETMVVWMASGNAAQIPKPWYNLLQPVRTLTATIAGEMGEADQVTGSARYHVLFAMALCLLVISFTCNMGSEWVVRRERRKLRGQ